MSTTALEQARTLTLPSREAMLQRAPSVQAFWLEHQTLLSEAWSEWENVQSDTLPQLSDSLINPEIKNAVDNAWKQPLTENAVKELWQEVVPGVYQCQFFAPDKLPLLNQYLDHVADAKIPLRPPYGIVLNRRGMMLDRRSQGYLATPHFQAFYQMLIDVYMRPISRLLFPEVTGHDTQSFGFSIQYQPSKDTSIRPHTDASAVTLNINLNAPGETFSGSTVDFFNPETGKTHALTFEPGTAVIHRGNVPHAAQPITSGTRSNLVLWLYGENGFVPRFDSTDLSIPPEQRWTIPATVADNFAPF